MNSLPPSSYLPDAEATAGTRNLILEPPTQNQGFHAGTGETGGPWSAGMLAGSGLPRLWFLPIGTRPSHGEPCGSGDPDELADGGLPIPVDHEGFGYPWLLWARSTVEQASTVASPSGSPCGSRFHTSPVAPGSLESEPLERPLPTIRCGGTPGIGHFDSALLTALERL